MFTYIVGPVLAGWIGSVELRMRNLVGKDRFNDLKEQTTRIEDKMDQLLLKNGISPRKGDDGS